MSELRELRQRVQKLETQLAQQQRHTGGIPVRHASGGSGGEGIWKAETFAALEALTGPTEGDLGYTLDDKYWYGYDDAGWHILHAFRQASPPFGIGERDGDLWNDTSTGYTYYLKGSVWHVLPTVVSGKLYYYTGSADLLVSHFE